MMLLTFDCSGCFETVEKIRLGVRDTIQGVAPQGWVAFDPYTHCTYCPKCWAEIVQGANTPLARTRGGGGA